MVNVLFFLKSELSFILHNVDKKNCWLLRKKEDLNLIFIKLKTFLKKGKRIKTYSNNQLNESKAKGKSTKDNVQLQDDR